MATLTQNVRRVPNSLVVLVLTIVMVALTLAILRLVFNPTEEAMRASAEDTRVQRRAVATVTQAAVADAAPASPSAPDVAGAAAGPTIGDTQAAADGLEVTLLSVDDVTVLEQFAAGAYRPKRDLLRVVTIEFANGGAENAVVDAATIAIIQPDGSRVRVDSQATDALLTAPDSPTEGRPFYVLETLVPERRIVIAVVFDLNETEGDAAIEIAGMSFVVPPTSVPEGIVAEESADSETTAAADAEAGADWAATRGQARVIVEEQTAVSRTGLPTVGDTQIDAAGFEATLVSITNVPKLPQFNGKAFETRFGTFKLVTVRFRNGTPSGTTIAKSNIVLISPDGTETAVDNPGTNALTGMVPDIERGRPLYLIESLPAGKSVQVAVVFDVPVDWTGLNIEIEGFLFEMPDPE